MEDEDTPDTRVFVSGLPTNFTSNQLGAHFAGRYQITDAVVIPDRRIGFVGFRNYTLAKSAIKYFDKTYIRLSKISVDMAKAVELERTSNPNGIPNSKYSNQGRPPRPATSDSVPPNKRIESSTKSDLDSAFQSYVPVLSSNKRKRESVGKLQDEPSETGIAIPASLVAPGHESVSRKSAAAEQEDRDLKRAKRKENKKHQEHKADGEDRGHDQRGHEEKTSTTLETKRKKKKAEAQAIDFGAEDVVEASVPENLEERLKAEEVKEIKKKEKKKKKNKNQGASNIGADGNHDHGDNPDFGEDKMGRKETISRPQVNDDTKGGVEPIAVDACEAPGQSADQIKQRRRKYDITSDSDWLRAKTSRVLDLIDEAPKIAPPAVPEPEEQSNETTAGQETKNIDRPSTPSGNLPSAPIRNTSFSSGRVFVRNLPYTAKELDIEDLFSKYGQIDEVHLVRDKAGISKGVGYVHFSDNAAAQHAFQELDGKAFQGRLLHILEAAAKKSRKLDDYEISKLPHRKQKALKRKIEAGTSTFKWNSMYMNPNAILSSVADRLGVTKADLIDASSSEAAVKQAHAEAYVIQETQAYFASNGVNLEAFKQYERDDTTLLVKNFPFGTTAQDLKGLFAPHGDIVKLLLPPSGTTAIIQYAQPGEGSQALRNLAYRNLNGSVLYLEKAPKNLLDIEPRTVPDTKSPANSLAVAQEDLGSGKADESSPSTLFIRNLNFATTTTGLISAFKPLSGFLSARVKTKIDPRRPQEVLSMGFGFVEFSSNQLARAALATMNGHSLDNHDLVVQVSRKVADAAEEQRQKDKSKKASTHNTKIVIKNLPFEATKKDVRSLLGAYGQLRSVKVPQKFDRSTRGFAFADFVTAKEAENVMEALKDTHLLGRRLVLEFAEEESIDPEDEIRAIESKVGRQTDIVQLQKMTGSARRKFNVGTQDDL